MSLINNMLKDLEVRKDGAGRVERPIFQDLHSTHSGRRRGRGLWVVVPVLMVLGGTAYYSWNRWGDELTGRTTSPAPAVTRVPAPPAIPEPPAPAPTPVLSQVQESAPAAAVVTKPPKPAARPTSPKMDEVDRAGNKRSKPAKASGAAAVKPSAEDTNSNRQDERSRATSSAEAGPGRMEKTERPYTADEQAENTYQQAARLKAQGNAVAAERQLEALLAAQPKHVKARDLLVSIHLENSRVPEAQEALEQGVAQVPAHLAFRYQLARLYLERGDEARAVSLLEEARRQGHSDPELPAFLAALYQRAGRHADAVKSYQAALAARPQEGRWWVGLGISLEDQQDSGAARDAYRHALDTGRLASNLARYAEDRLRALIAH
jgi:MSHA biogenesis protein MshN